MQSARRPRFIEAVAAARAAAGASPQGNPGRLPVLRRSEGAWAPGPGANHARPLSDQFAAVASPVSLTVALENLAIGSEYGGARRDSQLDSVRFLESQFSALWGGMGAVAEAFGVAYAAVKETDKAIAWYTAAVQAADGSASFKAAEQLGNQLVRRGERGKAADARGDIRAGIEHLERVAAVQAGRKPGCWLAYKSPDDDEWRAATGGSAKALASALEHYLAAETTRVRLAPATSSTCQELAQRTAAEHHRSGATPTTPPAHDEVARPCSRPARAGRFWSSRPYELDHRRDAEARLADVVRHDRASPGCEGGVHRRRRGFGIQGSQFTLERKRATRTKASRGRGVSAFSGARRWPSVRRASKSPGIS